MITSGNESMEWIAGCSAVVKPDSTSENADSVDSLNEMNHNIADKIAGMFCPCQVIPITNVIVPSENLLKSPRFPQHFELLIAKFKDSHPHVKLLGHLIGISLIRQSTGSRQIESAYKIMQTINLSELSGIDDLSQEHLALEVMNLAYLVGDRNLTR